MELNLFTTEQNNTKLKKSRFTKYQVIALFLSPHKANRSKVNLCPFASKSCVAACLNTSGMSRIFPAILKARERKANEFLSDRKRFTERVKKEIEVYARRADLRGRKLAVRLNGTTDIDYPSHVFESFPNVQFYDYTKNPYRMEKFLAGALPKNYHLTFSFSGENLDECKRTVKAGGNVATVFSSDNFPATWLGAKVVTGEESDLRFLDPRGVIIGLKAKGEAKKEEIGGSFVIQIDRREKTHG